MRDLKRFGTDDYPLHCSGLYAMVQCPWRAAMQYFFTPDDEAGPAADTGSAMHLAAAEMHRGKEVASCLESMRANLHKYPAADLRDAAGMFLSYAQDPRNTRAKILLVEKRVSFQIEPAKEDPTQAPIKVVGTLDQVREVDGTAFVLDIKTSKRDPQAVLWESTLQVAAYCVGASYLLNMEVQPGPLIMPRLYAGRDPGSAPVFRHFPWKLRDTAQILEGVRRAVCAIRTNNMYHMPNDGCKWCMARTPDICLPKLIEVRNYVKEVENATP